MFINAVTLSVADQDRALKFYTEKLGFEVRMDAPMQEGGRWIMIAPPNAQTSIVLSLEPEKAGGFTPHIFEVDDVFETHKQLAGKGVEFVDAPSMQYYGGWTTFKDSEGNVTGIHSPVRETAGANS
jgi:catechol 2,3-dioxygenase-like lactoylglutathione lyase family enzyme